MTNAYVFMLKNKFRIIYTTTNIVIFVIPIPTQIIGKKNTPLGTTLNKDTNTKPNRNQTTSIPKAEGKTKQRYATMRDRERKKIVKAKLN